MSGAKNAAWFGRWGLDMAVAGLLSLAGAAQAQVPPPELARLVQLPPGSHSLEEVLADLSCQSGLLFSYSSSRIALSRRYTGRPGPARPLRVVLAEVLGAEGVSYGLLDGQLVLWPAVAAPPTGVAVLSANRIPSKRPSSLHPTAPLINAGETAAASRRNLPALGPASRPANNSYLPRTHDRPPAVVSGSKPSLRKPAAIALAKSSAPRRGSTVPHIAVGSEAGVKATTGAASLPRGRKAASAKALTTAPATAQTSRVARRGQQVAARSRPGFAQAPPYSPQALQRNAWSPKVVQAQSPQPAANGPLASLELRPISAVGGIESAEMLAARFSQGQAGSPPLPAVLAGLPLLPFPPPAPVPPPADPKARTRSARRLYLHGEAWASGTLPLNGLVKFGIPRAYLVLGAATGPFDRRTGVAWGVGLGTTGPAWGRFTTSLDLLHWALPTDGDDGITHARLFQLRPVLSYALKASGRLQLVAGPTLNLAMATRNAQRVHWEFADNRWTWLESSDDGTLLRLWPGMQVGLRF